MLNDRWQKRILRAQYNKDVIAHDDDVIISVQTGVEMGGCVKYNEKLMDYLQAENASGHATNCDMLIASVNPIQHMREAILTANVSADDDYYIIKFPFGVKTIELKLTKKAVDDV